MGIAVTMVINTLYTFWSKQWVVYIFGRFLRG